MPPRLRGRASTSPNHSLPHNYDEPAASTIPLDELPLRYSLLEAQRDALLVERDGLVVDCNGHHDHGSELAKERDELHADAADERARADELQAYIARCSSAQRMVMVTFGLVNQVLTHEY